MIKIIEQQEERTSKNSQLFPSRGWRGGSKIYLFGFVTKLKINLRINFVITSYHLIEKKN